MNIDNTINSTLIGNLIAWEASYYSNKNTKAASVNRIIYICVCVTIKADRANKYI